MDDLEGIDLYQLRLYGWNMSNSTWDMIPASIALGKDSLYAGLASYDY